MSSKWCSFQVTITDGHLNILYLIGFSFMVEFLTGGSEVLLDLKLTNCRKQLAKYKLLI